MTEPFERFCGLGIKRDRTREVEAVEFIDAFHHDSFTGCLAYQTIDLGVSLLAVDDNLRGVGSGRVALLDALLQTEHHGAGGIDDLDAVVACSSVGGWGLAVGT